MLTQGSGNPQHDLNHCMPVAHTVRLGDLLNDIIIALNQTIAQHAALLAACVANPDLLVLTATVALPAPTAVPNRLTTVVAPEIADLP